MQAIFLTNEIPNENLYKFDFARSLSKPSCYNRAILLWTWFAVTVANIQRCCRDTCVAMTRRFGSRYHRWLESASRGKIDPRHTRWKPWRFIHSLIRAVEMQRPQVAEEGHTQKLGSKTGAWHESKSNPWGQMRHKKQQVGAEEGRKKRKKHCWTHRHGDCEWMFPARSLRLVYFPVESFIVNPGI